MDIKITYDDTQVKRALLAAPSQAEKALVRTLNRVAAKARVQSSRKVRETYNIKAKDLNDSTKVTQARRNNLMAEIVITGKPIGLIKFDARPSTPTYPPPKQGLTYKIKKTSGRSKLPHAFIARMASGHIGVFERHGTKIKGKAQKIREKKFIGMPSVFRSDKIMSVVRSIIDKELPKEWVINWRYYSKIK